MALRRVFEMIARGYLPVAIGSKLNIPKLLRYRRKLGWPAASKLRAAETAFAREKVTRIHDRLQMKGYANPLHFRRGSSDLWVIQQVFVDEQYDCLDGSNPEPLIIDCGANIGCSSFYFLSRYPGARVVAVEPDPANAELCRRNLEPFGERARVVQAAVWPEVTKLELHDPGIHQWGIQVRIASAGASTVPTVTIPDLLQSSGWDHVDLMKIDIEGSEAELFHRGTEGWLPRVQAIAIELHGGTNNERFFRALEDFECSQSTRGEISICSGLRPKAQRSLQE